jgi:hypothetical protein
MKGKTLLFIAIFLLVFSVAALAMDLSKFSYDGGETLGSEGYNGNGTYGNGSPSGDYAEGPDCKKIDMRLATTYVPGGGGVEGGVNDASGNHKVHTLEEYLNGDYQNSPEGNYSTLAGDINRSGSMFKYGDQAYVPAIEQKIGKPIAFRITDTGAASLFHDNNGYQHIDIGVSDRVYINGGSGDLGSLGINGSFVMYVGAGCDQGSTNPSIVDGSLAQKIVQIAEGEIGNGPLRKYYQGSGVPNGTAWCAYFATWVFNQAGAKIPVMGGAQASFDYIANKNQRITANGAPLPGDYVLIRSPRSPSGEHVGIVVAVNGNKITTVEGNANHKVEKNTYTNLRLGDEEIQGYARFK